MNAQDPPRNLTFGRPSVTNPGPITQLLDSWSSGDAAAMEQRLAMLYDLMPRRRRAPAPP